jgi:undecaprenyl-diphosphatase
VIAGLAAVALAVLAGAIVARRGAPFSLDEALHHWSVVHRLPAAVTAARLVAATAGGVLPFVIAGVSGWFGCGKKATPARKALTAAAAALIYVVGMLLLRDSLTVAMARPRPPRAEALVIASGGSFPSGHATSSALAVWFVLWAARRAVRPPAARACAALAVTWGVAVGLTRVYLGAHWPTDVVGGWLLAAAWIALTAPLLSRADALRSMSG